MRPAQVPLLVVLAAVCLGQVPTVRAAIVATGDVRPGDPNAWDSSTSGSIAYDADGSIKVTGGSDLSSGFSTIGRNSGVTGTVIVTDAGSTWTTGEFHVGGLGHGILQVTDGGTLTSTNSGVGGSGNFVGGIGLATVKGPGAVWNSSMLYVGSRGNGILNVSDGACVGSSGFQVGGYYGPTGIVTLDGHYSALTNSKYFRIGAVGSAGGGTLAVTGGATVVCTSGTPSFIGGDAGGKGLVTVNGPGSSWTNSSGIELGAGGSGTLNVIGGGVVAASTVSISGLSRLAIDVGNGSNLAVGGGSGTLTNFGTVRFQAGAGATAEKAYQPISAGTWTGPGTCQAIGGTWNTDTHAFTASQIQQASSGTPISIDLLNKQRVRTDDAATGWSLGTSFLASNVSKPLSFTGTAPGLAALTSLLQQMQLYESVQAAWQCAATGGYTAGDPAYLSMNVANAYTRDDLSVRQYDGSVWSDYAASDLTVNGPWASFTVTGLGTYALIGGPAHVTWSGSTNSTWSTAAGSGNWKRSADGISADYGDGFHVTFDDSAAGTTAEISASNVTPLSVTFNNSNRDFTITGAKGIAGTSTTVKKQGGGTVTIGSVNTYGGVTTVEAGKLVLQGTAKAMTPVLNNAGADIKGGMLVLDYSGEASPAATVKSLMTTSYAGTGGSHFNTGKFQSSTADARHGLGWKDDTGAKQISVTLTLYGDASLDGMVNLSDLTLFGQSWNGSDKVWAQGDFNYDGAVNLSDLTLLGQNWNQGIAGFVPAGPTISATPEPSTFVMLVILAAAIGAWGIRRPARLRAFGVRRFSAAFLSFERQCEAILAIPRKAAMNRRTLKIRRGGLLLSRQSLFDPGEPLLGRQTVGAEFLRLPFRGVKEDRAVYA